MAIPSLISFHLINPILTHPAEATAANGTNLPKSPRVVGDRPRSRGTSVESPTAMAHEATVAEA
jgi:hypothetical protein